MTLRALGMKDCVKVAGEGERILGERFCESKQETLTIGWRSKMRSGGAMHVAVACGGKKRLAFSAVSLLVDVSCCGVVDLSGKIVTRDVLISALVEALQPLSYVHAFYESGAIAFNRLDEWSDLDLYVVVDDGRTDDAFVAVEAALRSLSPVRQKFGIPQLPWPGVSQAFYRLERASEYLLIDLAVIALSGPEKFLAPEIHGKAVFYFNKSDRVKVPSVDREELTRTLQQRLVRLKDRFSMFNIFVQKELNRENYLEALVLYHSMTLGSVVDVLRIKYSPFHHDFKTRYVQYELPKPMVKKLEQLYFVKDSEDLRVKYHEATGWFNRLIAESG